MEPDHCNNGASSPAVSQLNVHIKLLHWSLHLARLPCTHSIQNTAHKQWHLLAAVVTEHDTGWSGYFRNWL